MKKKKRNMIVGVILFIMLLGIGYAFLSTSLMIDGTTEINSNTWNIYWDDIHVTTGSVTADEPTINTSKTTVSFSVHLSKPGDFYEFTVDAKNDGSIDGMIDTITKTINGETTIPDYLQYDVTYQNGAAVASHQLLAANSSETYLVRVAYRTDINASDLPSTAESLSLSFSATYIQADSQAQAVPFEVISISGVSCSIGSPIPEGVTTYSSFEDVAAIYGERMFLRHVITNNVISESYVGFVQNGKVYYLRGGGATYQSSTSSYLNDSPYYADNVSVLQEVFSDGACGTDSNYFYCYQGDYEAAVYQDGGVYYLVGDPGCEHIDCHIESDGESFCY